MSQLFVSGGQNIGVYASVLTMNIQNLFSCKSHSFDDTNLFSKVMSLLFNMLSRFVGHTFSSKDQASFLISWLHSLCAVILEPKKIKSVTVSIVSPSISHEVMGLNAMILVF